MSLLLIMLFRSGYGSKKGCFRLGFMINTKVGFKITLLLLLMTSSIATRNLSRIFKQQGIDLSRQMRSGAVVVG